MGDGKVCVALNDATSSLTFYIYQPMNKSTHINNLDLIIIKDYKEDLQFHVEFLHNTF